MNISFAEALQKWANENGFILDDKDWSGIQIGQRHEIEDALVELFDGYGESFAIETGLGPHEYLPNVVEVILASLSPKEWALEDVYSEDDWDTAIVEMIHCQGDDYQFKVNEVCDSDWIPSNLFSQMGDFSKSQCNKTVVTFYGAEAYRVLMVVHKQANSLEAIISRYAEPYP